MTTDLPSKVLSCLAAGLLLTHAGFAQLTITAQAPAANASHVPANASIRLTGSQTLDPASAGALQVRSAARDLHRNAAGPRATISGNELTYAPAGGWLPGEKVQVTVGQTLRATGGQPLQSPRIVQFTAAAAGPGRGYFAPRAAVTFSGPPLSHNAGAWLADVDADGDLDLLAAIGTASTAPQSPPTSALLVRLNNGAGQFSGGGDYNLGIVGCGPAFLKIGDLDGDGDLDVITLSNGTTVCRYVVCSLNDGNGRFTAVPFSGGFGARFVGDIALADVDADGDLDFLHSSQQVNSVTVWAQHSNGSFVDNNNYVITPPPPRNMAPVDVDNDGDLDLVINHGFISAMSVRLNNGRGLFPAQVGSDYPARSGAFTMAVADLDNDGDPDVVTGDQTWASNPPPSTPLPQTASVFLNNGSGIFASGPEVALSFVPKYLTTADVDGDGDQDLLASSPSSNIIGVRYNTGNGRFAGGPDLAVPAAPTRLAVGDIDGDGDLDLAGITGEGTIDVYLNQATAAPLASTRTRTSSSFTAGAYPVPHQKQLSLRVQAAQAGPTQLAFYDAKGSLVHQSTVQLRPGANELDLSQSVQTLPPGLVLLTVTQGRDQQVLKLRRQE